MEKKWNYLLNGLGVAIIGILLGSNVEYAANNYGILTHNLSYAVLSSTGGTVEDGTGSEFEEYIDVETLWETDFGGNPVFGGCPMMFNDDEASAWAVYKIKSSVRYNEISNIKIGEEIYSFNEGDLNLQLEEGESVPIIIRFDIPMCIDCPGSCCYMLHPKEKLRNVRYSLE